MEREMEIERGMGCGNRKRDGMRKWKGRWDREMEGGMGWGNGKS